MDAVTDLPQSVANANAEILPLRVMFYSLRQAKRSLLIVMPVRGSMHRVIESYFISRSKAVELDSLVYVRRAKQCQLLKRHVRLRVRGEFTTDVAC